jgi:hypothetical protein
MKSIETNMIRMAARPISALLLGLAITSVTPAARAAVVELTAKYEPVAGSSSLEFVNTTPITGNRSNPTHKPKCEAAQIWGMAVPGIRGTKLVYTSSSRKRLYIRMPWNTVNVPVESADGRTFVVELRIEAAGYRLGTGGGETTIFRAGQEEIENTCSAIVTGTGIGSTLRKSLFILAQRSGSSSTCWNRGFTDSFSLPVLDSSLPIG